MDPRRSLQRIGKAHLADQLAYLQRNCWPATPRFRFPAPIQSEPGAMPFDRGLRLDNRQRIANARAKPIEAHKINRSMALKVCFLEAARRRTFICCRSIQISISSAARDRNRSAAVQAMSLTSALIPQQHRTILDQLPVRLGLRQGQGLLLGQFPKQVVVGLLVRATPFNERA
jgi:hypothetical protein